jgi:anaerobic magnesium-protoporphyrin IX monomethyl ester cyclase
MISGIYFRHGAETVFTGDRRPPADLDKLPFPAWELVDLSRYRPAPNDYFRRPHASFIGSRGCPNTCVFCPSDSHVRFRSVPNMLEEINWLIRYHGVKDLIFWDESILISPERTRKLCEEIMRRKIDLTWTANARVDQVEPKILKLMKRAGCRQLLFGLESGVPKNLETLGKGFTVEQARAAVKTANEAGILALGMFIFGIPGETVDEAKQTIAFARSLNLSHASFVYFTPYPGTALNEKLRKSPGGSILPDAPYDMKAPSYVPDGMTREGLIALQTLAFKRFYLRPREIFKQLKANINRYKIRDGIQGLLTLLFS